MAGDRVRLARAQPPRDHADLARGPDRIDLRRVRSNVGRLLDDRGLPPDPPVLLSR
jgi:hypothetical protein